MYLFSVTLVSVSVCIEGNAVICWANMACRCMDMYEGR